MCYVLIYLHHMYVLYVQVKLVGTDAQFDVYRRAPRPWCSPHFLTAACVSLWPRRGKCDRDVYYLLDDCFTLRSLKGSNYDTVESLLASRQDLREKGITLADFSWFSPKRLPGDVRTNKMVCAPHSSCPCVYHECVLGVVTVIVAVTVEAVANSFLFR
jgi:hypothetical protein